MTHWLARLVRHRLLDEGDAARVLGVGAAERIAARIAESERRHGGEIRVMVEAGLPISYLRRKATPRERAIAMFGKLGVWDTERNNGVLVYLLLAERAIEIVADRGLSRHVGDDEWARVAATMSGEFAAGRFEAGLLRAIDAVDALLVRHFPPRGDAIDRNELPDAPVFR